jgi:hypothetical protein
VFINLLFLLSIMLLPGTNGLYGSFGWTRPWWLLAPLVVVGMRLKLTRSRSVGHGLGSAEHRYSLPRCEISNVIKPSRGFLAAGRRRFGASPPNYGHSPGEL